MHGIIPMVLGLGGPRKRAGGYLSAVLNTRPANLLGYWPLDESAGTVVNDQSGNVRHGTSSNVTVGAGGIGDGKTSYQFVPASTSLCNLYTASLAGAFNAAEGSLMAWIKLTGAAVWADGQTRRVCTIGADGTNRILLQKAGETLSYVYTAGGTSESVTTAAQTAAGWLHLVLTWSKSSGASGEVKAYLNGAQVLATQETLGVWVGALAATSVVLGAASTGGAALWDGYLAHVALWSAPLTLAEITTLYVPAYAA